MAEGGTFNGVFIDENILGVAKELEAMHPGLVYYVGHPAIPEIPASTKDPDLIERHWNDIVSEVGTQSGPSLWALTRRDGLKPID